MYNVMHLPGVIEIGVTGENQFRRLEFDMRPWLEVLPGGVGSIVHIRPGETGDDAYVAATTMEDGILTWELTAGDVGEVEGYGQMEIWLEDPNTARGKSAKCQTYVRSSLALTHEIPEAQEAWLEQMTGLKTETVIAAQSAEDAMEAAESAQAAAEAARDAAQAAAGDFQGLSATASGLAAGTSPTVNVTHDEGGLFNFAFGIPKGDKGDQGDPPTDSQVQTAANNYLSQVITNPDSPPLDRALSSNAAAAPADMVGDLKSALDETKESIEKLDEGLGTLAGNFVIGALDKTTVYPSNKYTVCNPTIQQYNRDIVFTIKSGFKINVNFFNSEGERTAAYNNRIDTFTVPKDTRFNLSIRRNPEDTSEVITDIDEFVNAISFNTNIEQRMRSLETKSDKISYNLAYVDDGNTVIKDGWQIGTLDRTIVYPNVNRYRASNPLIRSFDYDKVVHVKTNYQYNLQIFNSLGERISIINNIRNDRVIAKGTLFNLSVMRYPIDEDEVLNQTTLAELSNAIYFRSNFGSELDELKKTTDPIEEPSDYYFENDYLQDKIQRIKTLAKQCAANGDIFIFVTDQHWTINAKQSLPLIRYIANNCSIPMLISGGDTDDYGSEPYCTALRGAFKNKIYHVVGNHDWFAPTDGDTLGYWMDIYNKEQKGNPTEHYYYVDNEYKKIRYIILNAWINDNGTLVSGYNAAQLNWFTQEALNVNQGWDIIVFTHYLGATTPAPENAYMFRDAIDAYNANAASNGKVILIISGHYHADAVCHTTGGVPIVLVTCDKYRANGPDNWLTSTRIVGTTTEQAFDVMLLNRNSRTLTALRIGCPAMDNTDTGIDDAGFDYTPTLEERVIVY